MGVGRISDDQMSNSSRVHLSTEILEKKKRISFVCVFIITPLAFSRIHTSFIAEIGTL